MISLIGVFTGFGATEGMFPGPGGTPKLGNNQKIEKIYVPLTKIKNTIEYRYGLKYGKGTISYQKNIDFRSDNCKGCCKHSIENILIDDKQVLGWREFFDPRHEEVLFLEGRANMTFKKGWKHMVETK